VLLQNGIGGAPDGFVFTEELLNLTFTAVHLSEAAYSYRFDEDPAAWLESQGVIVNSLKIWERESDTAIVASFVEQAGRRYCFAAFRGTRGDGGLSSLRDWRQNLMFVGRKTICPEGRDQCCMVFRGSWDAYDTSFREELAQALRSCASDCSMGTCPTVVLTGHSQGGGIATSAAVDLEDLNPTVITFGQPPVLEVPCALVNSSRFYRFTNSRTERKEVGRLGLLDHVVFRGNDIVYDPVPAAPYAIDHVGHQILLGDDPTGVAYIGLDSDVKFRPLDVAGLLENRSASSHLLWTSSGYRNRIRALVHAYSRHSGSQRSFPVRSSGFSPGTLCTQNIECNSGMCEGTGLFSGRRCR
jgi:pimeloyl-ACP methyl ester carboxylesterase